MSYEGEFDNVLIVDDNSFLKTLKQMKDRREITLEQYAESLRRAKEK